MILNDLSKEFHPCPKPMIKNRKEFITIKKKSTKLAQKERKRASILQKSKKCFICGFEKDLDIHEAFGGRNRQKSMEYGLIFYLCRKHHRKVTDDEKLQLQLREYAQSIFNSKYGAETFIKEFGKNYLKK